MATAAAIHFEWQKLARESERAALMVLKACPRSATSRAYYAAYQAMSATLQYSAGRLPPHVDAKGRQREAWPHANTPEFVRVHLGPILNDRTMCRELKSRLGKLYKLREIADYVSRIEVDHETAAVATREGSFLVKVAARILPTKEAR